METYSALLAICAGNSPVSGEFPAQRPVTRSVYVFFDLCLNKQLSKQSWGWWFETLRRPLWRHCNACNCNTCVVPGLNHSVIRLVSCYWLFREIVMIEYQSFAMSSNGNMFRVTGPLWGETTGYRWIHLKRSMTRSFDVFFDLRLNKRLIKQSRSQWFETSLQCVW